MSLQIIISSLLCSIIFSISCPEMTGNKVDINLEIKEILTIGGPDVDEIDYMFGTIQGVVVDREGNIYVTELFGQDIRVFDQRGKIIKRLGGQGRGPGEFTRILSLTLDLDGNLLLMDQANSRVSILKTNGELIEDFAVKSNQVRQISSFYNRGYVFVYYDANNDNLLHIYNKDFELEESFLNSDNVKSSDDRFEDIMLRFLPGRFLVYDSSTIYFAPTLYAGKIFRFVKSNGGDWTLTNELQGHVEKSAFTPVDIDRADEEAYIFNLGTSGAAAYIHNETRGLFKLSDGSIIHFTSTEQNGKKIFGAEVFSKNSEFLGYIKLREQIDGNLYALHIDDEDNVYVSDTTNEPTLRKFQIIKSN